VCCAFAIVCDVEQGVFSPFGELNPARERMALVRTVVTPRERDQMKDLARKGWTKVRIATRHLSFLTERDPVWVLRILVGLYCVVLVRSSLVFVKFVHSSVASLCWFVVRIRSCFLFLTRVPSCLVVIFVEVWSMSENCCPDFEK